MKSKNLLLKCMLMLLLFTSASCVMAQGPYPNTGNHQVCINATEPYGVVLNAGSAYAWSITPLAGGNGTITAGATSNLISVKWVTAGIATLKVIETNAGGCAGDPVTINVTINPIPTVTVNSSAICAGTSATITATPGLPGTYSYAWTVPVGVPNPGNVASFTSTIAGTYAVVITNTVAACVSASANGTVTISAAPALVITNPAACAATADLTAASITAGSTAGLVYTYFTDAAATISYTTPTAATAGTYYIRGTLGATCFDIKPVTVSVGVPVTVVVTNPAAGCATVDITAAAITADSTPGLTFTYWTNAAATIPYTTPTLATSGTYYIKGVSAGGCTVVQPVVVTINPAPTPVITGPSPACESIGGTTSTYSTPIIAGHTYNWVVAGGTIASGQATDVINIVWAAGAGSVSVTETITAGGCNASVVKAVTVTPKPVTSSITHN